MFTINIQFFQKFFFQIYRTFQTWGSIFPKIFYKHFFKRVLCVGDCPPFLTVKMTYREGGYVGGEGYTPIWGVDRGLLLITNDKLYGESPIVITLGHILSLLLQW